jgi:hypothetical protein
MFRVVISSLAFLLISCSVELNAAKNHERVVSLQDKTSIFRKLVEKVISVNIKNDADRCLLDEICNIYEWKLFPDIGFMGKKSFYEFLEINFIFAELIHTFPQNTQEDYEFRKQFLIRDLEELLKLNISVKK